MSSAAKEVTILHADQEHGGFRFVILLALFIGYLIGVRIVFLLINILAPPSIIEFALFLSCIGGLPIAIFFIWGLEKILKLTWHSGLSLELDEQGLTAHDRRSGTDSTGSDTPAMIWSAHINRLNWYFRLAGYPRGGRERRARENWLCVATELQQNEMRLSIFTMTPPDEAAEWIENPALDFRILSMTELYDNDLRSRVGPPIRPEIPNRLLQTKEGRYWLAERRRWEHGVELTPEDFKTLMTYVDKAT